MTVDAAVKAAKKGAKYLDRTWPGWFHINHINLTDLNQESIYSCVLGQLEGSFDDAMDKRGDENFKPDAMGFDILPSNKWEGDEDDYWNTLTRTWKQEIRARRSAYSKALKEATAA